MPCKICDHTLEAVGERQGEPIYHCPRCGTLVVGAEVYIPTLVCRCQKFQTQLGPAWGAQWTIMGIRESINLPGQRGEG